MIVEVGAIHLVLNCLSIFTHHNSNIAPGPEMIKPTAKTPAVTVSDEQVISDDKSHVYWAKGTGFGTGSTQQSWNVEQALLRQKSEEEHVTVLLQVTSINSKSTCSKTYKNFFLRSFQATLILAILFQQLKRVTPTTLVIVIPVKFVIYLLFLWTFLSSRVSILLCAPIFAMIRVGFLLFYFLPEY